ncbi:MAG: anti-anti-sigma factor [Phycisphaerae bacterium]|nr:anti-anti-sigma factor [Phycisphaerae bacterium]
MGFGPHIERHEMTPGELNITTETLDEMLIVRPTGEVDLGCATLLQENLATALAGTTNKLIIDLVGVPYMDSSGVATLVEAMQVARRNNINLLLCNMQDRVRSIFEIARLDTVFVIVDDIDAARGV